MTNTKDLIMKLKAVRDEKGLSYGDILNLMEKNGDYLAKSTISRVFADGSEEMSFRYEETIRPIANALLDIETIEDDDNMDTRAMKSLLKYKIERIEELEKQIEGLETALDKEKIRAYEELEDKQAQWAKTIEFLKEQISLKDKRMDMLLNAVFEKDTQHKALLENILSCPCRKAADYESREKG